MSRARSRDLWLPALIGIAGVLVSLAGWGLLIANRRALILESTAETAAQTREVLEMDLEQQIGALRALSEFWSRLGLESLPEGSAVHERMDRIEGLTSLAWIDLDEPRSIRIVGAERPAAEAELDWDEVRRHPGQARIVGPERSAAGGIAFRAVLPVRTPEEGAGALVARFHVASLLESVLRARARGYALSVLWDGEEIFSRGVPTGDPWQRWWRVEETISLPFAGQWQLVQRPSAETAALRLTPLPHYLLVTGILLSLVLAIVCHQFRVIVRQARFLAASNRALEQRGLELESRVAERTEALRDAIAELEAFNYSVSHDLRSPLGAILNFTAILEEDHRGRPLDGEGLAILARIRRSASRATSLLEDLLQLSQAGRAALAPERVDVTTLAREAFHQVRAAEDDSDVEFLLDPLPAAVADPTLLANVFANLFSNALKYSRGCDARRIAVSGRVEEDRCVYEVADNGRGFDMRFSEKLFGLFERLHANEDVEGTGVGLAMVARIVKRHGGCVWAEGKPGEGARFSFALPVREAP